METEVIQVNSMPRASVTLRGTFSHEQYRRVCDALDRLGSVYNSMCAEENSQTVVLISVHTCSTKEELEAAVRHIVDSELIVDLDVHIQEDMHAEKCI